MPEAPAATPVLSTTRTSSPALARCQAVERPWTPAPMTRCLADAGREGGTGAPSGLLPMTQWHCRFVVRAYRAMYLIASARSAARRRSSSGTAFAGRGRTGAPNRPGGRRAGDTPGGADEQVRGRAVAQVRERVVAAARRERHRAGAGGGQLVAELERQLAL